LTDGAGRAAYRLHSSLLLQGIDSIMLVACKEFNDDTVIQVAYGYTDIDNPVRKSNDLLFRVVGFVKFIIKQFNWKINSIKWKPASLYNFNISYASFNQIKKYLICTDILCFYSIQSFISTSLIKRIYNFTKAPILWTPMDIEPLTGGCHFNNGCDIYRTSCGSCPQLEKGHQYDISRRILSRKKKCYQKIPITLIACSSEINKRLSKSLLFNTNRIKQIYLGVNQYIFKRIDKNISCEILGISSEKKKILFGCFNLQDKRKGGSKLISALDHLYGQIILEELHDENSIEVITIGREKGFDFSKIPFQHRHLGIINDDRILSLVYNSVDVFASPSLDDFGPMMVNEAFACGTPIVSYNIGVAPDLITQNETGYVAKNFDSEDFSIGLQHFLFEWKSINNKVNTFDNITSNYQSKKYITLFEEMIDN